MTATLLYIAPWVLGAVCIGLAIGFFVGRSTSKGSSTTSTGGKHEDTLKVLVDVLEEIERISGDITCRTTEIAETARSVDNLQVAPEAENLKQAVLGRVANLLVSNKQLEGDLLYTQYRMEAQAEEIDSVRREARTDELTKVGNRKAFDERYHVLFRQWTKEQKPFSLVMVDLDHFKRINDSHGHQAGDRVLELVGAAMQDLVREHDYVARFGGDEFAMLLVGAQLDTGVQIARRIQAQISEELSAITHNGDAVSVGLSMGVAAVRQDDTSESLLARADAALYKSKHQGRHQVTSEASLTVDAAHQSATI